MNIWQWVHDATGKLRQDGHHRLADLVDSIPAHTCDDRHDLVDASLPEALALARSIDHPWLEIFLRHWGLQSRVLHRCEGLSALTEAVSLLEFAHREDNERCPQAVCVVQDAASCYANADYIGYVPERLQVAQESLAKINPAWPCFQCISCEYGNALLDAGRTAEAAQFVEAQLAAARAEGTYLGHNFFSLKSSTLLEQGDAQAALDFLESAEYANACSDDGDRITRDLKRTRAYALLQRPEEALQALPAFDAVYASPYHYRAWVEAQQALIACGAKQPDVAWDAALRRLIERLRQQSAFGSAYAFAEIALQRSVEQRHRTLAEHELQLAEAMAAQLREPARVRPVLDELAAAIAALPFAHIATPADAMAAAAQCNSLDDAAAALDLVAAARRSWPAEGELALHQARLLWQLDLNDAAISCLRELLGTALAEQAAALLGDVLLEQRRDADLLALADAIAATDPGQAAWLRARLAYAKGDDATCQARLADVLALIPDALACREMWIDSARRSGNFAAMLVQADALLERGIASRNLHWDRMVAATIQGDWAKVRASGAAIGLELPEGDGPIDAPAELLVIRITTEHGDTVDRVARRTGPVTARITDVPPLAGDDYFDDLVVFEPAPLNPDETPDEDGHRPLLIFPRLATLAAGGYQCFALDGVHPGEAVWQQLVEALGAHGCVVQQRSGDAYRLWHPQTGAEHLAIFAGLAVPAGAALPDITATLSRLTAGLPHPLTWSTLAAHAGDQAQADSHATLLEQWEEGWQAAAGDEAEDEVAE